MDNRAHVEQAEVAAARWLLKRDSGHWRTNDEAELNDWLGADISHWVAFARLESVWDQTDRMRLLSGGSRSGRAPVPGAMAESPLLSRKMLPPAAEVSGFRARPRLQRWSAIAAAVVGAVALGVSAYVWLPSGTPYRTAVGGLSTVPMTDGSSITLNTDTEVRLNLSAAERRVDLTQGEAFFEVAKDPARPFMVYAEGQRVVVLGTQFSVRIKPDVVQVMVTDGEVRVDEAPLLRPDRRLANLKAGYVAEVSGERIAVDEVALEDLEQRLSWRSGYIALQRMPLGEAIAEFNRYNHRQLAIADPVAAGIRITGRFRRDNLDGFLRLLEDGFGIHARPRGDSIFLTRP